MLRGRVTIVFIRIYYTISVDIVAISGCMHGDYRGRVEIPDTLNI